MARRSSWSSSPNTIPQQPQHGVAHFKGTTSAIFADTEGAAISARTAALTFPRCCVGTVRLSIKLRGAGAEAGTPEADARLVELVSQCLRSHYGEFDPSWISHKWTGREPHDERVYAEFNKFLTCNITIDVESVARTARAMEA